MNGSYFNNPTFPNQGNMEVSPPGNISAMSMPLEQSLVENILRLNRGKKVKVYASYPDSVDWRDKIYEGVIEQSGKDHLILSDPTTGHWFLIRILYVNYVEFGEPINYNPDYSDTFR